MPQFRDPEPHAPPPALRVRDLMRLGSERLIASSRLQGLRVGVLANPASIDHDFRPCGRPPLRLAELHARGDFRPAARLPVGSPGQHDRESACQRPRRNVPIFSLYSETREPTPEMLELIDVLVVDIQDVGARIYTFIYTMANCLRAAARQGIPVIVCDRPNPIGGVAVEGPMLEHGYQSFVGQFPIPMRHGMTVAELARLFNDALRHRRRA